MKGSPPQSPQKGDEAPKEPGYYMADPIAYGLLKHYAKENRHNETLAEMVLWDFLRGHQLGVNFRRQHIIGMFIADFTCLPLKIIIELDGGYHQIPEQQVSDKERTQWLESKGFSVYRFTNEEILADTKETIQKIKKIIDERRAYKP